jgi:pilus assembly protein CpaF
MNAALVDRVRARLVAAEADASPRDVAAALRAEGLVLSDEAVIDLVSDLRQELVGAGPLEPLLKHLDVTDVLVNGPGSVWIDRGRGLERTDVQFRSDDDVRRLAQRLASTAGRRLDESVPYVDARLDDGTRLHAVLPPIATDGTLISLRIPRRRAFTLDELLERGTLDSAGAAWLRAIIEARLAFVISGGTGVGKTTVLATLLGIVPAEHRVVLVEDSAELLPDHPHVVRLQARPPNVEGAGSITMRDLVRQALRMRPDRLVVGEVRGAEVVDLLSALNTGHEGGCGTVHANSPGDVPARLEALGITAGLDRAAVHALIGAGLDAVVHLDRNRAGRRFVSGVHTFIRGERVTTRPALRRDGDALVPGPGLDTLAARLQAAGVCPPA